MKAVADYDLLGSENAVVASDLLKVRFLQNNVRRLTFNKDFWFGFFCDEQVDALRSTVQFQLLFQDQGRKTFILHIAEVMQPVLSYPFFRRQDQPAFPGKIIDKKCIFVLFDLEIERMIKIELRNLHIER